MFEFFSENRETVLAIVVASHGLALAIVNITPTPKDNKILAKVYRIIEMVAGIETRRVKE